MSKETLQWLNENVLIGYTDQRGHAWHYRASEQGTEPNHYAGPIPVPDVHRRLFAWTAEPVTLYHHVPCDIADDVAGLDETGAPFGVRAVPGKRAIRRSDTRDILGVFSEAYQPHQLGDWLVGNVSKLLGDGVGIGSAGLLRGGGVAWVQAEVEENVSTTDGVEFRPHLLAATSFDGSLVTTYKRSATLTVCDNTMAAALRSDGEVVKVKHTANSLLRITSAQAALGLIEQTAEAVTEEIHRLASWGVAEGHWARLLDIACKVDPDATTSRAATLADNKRVALDSLYRHDERCAPWSGTAFGVLQAFNTYRQHIAPVRGAERFERNQWATLSGTGDRADMDTLATLAAITG